MEQDREDMKHAMTVAVCGDKLHFCPLGEHPGRVLDLGTGTGIWAVDMGDAYPSAEVIGVDLSPIQPTFVPPNGKKVCAPSILLAKRKEAAMGGGGLEEASNWNVHLADEMGFPRAD